MDKHETEYRITLPDRYPSGSPGHEDPTAREGRYRRTTQNSINNMIQCLRTLEMSSDVFDVTWSPNGGDTVYRMKRHTTAGSIPESIGKEALAAGADLTEFWSRDGWFWYGFIGGIGWCLLGCTQPFPRVLSFDHRPTPATACYKSGIGYDDHRCINNDLPGEDPVYEVIDASEHVYTLTMRPIESGRWEVEIDRNDV